jgi:hypothetical protein
MNKLQVAVISDLHCHHSSIGPAESLLLTDADRSPSSQHPVESLLDLIKKDKLNANILLMPGDITNKIDRQGMISGWGFVGEIAGALKVETVAPTLGNHDVNSRKPEEDPFKIARGLSPKFPTSCDVLCDQFWANGFCLLEGSNYRILVINSVMSHTNEEAAKHGLVTPHQLDEISKALNRASAKQFQIAVCHHHPMAHEDIGLGASDLMENGSLLTQMLSEKGFHLLVHGHKHHPKLSYAPGAQALPVLAAGSFAAGMKNGLASRTRNVFHLITLEYIEGGEMTRGSILTWQFRQSKGWTPASWDAVDFPHITGFGPVIVPELLADQVINAFNGLDVPMAKWSSVVSSVPDLRYVPPSTFEMVGTILTTKGLDLQPSPPDEPKYIGRML